MKHGEIWEVDGQKLLVVSNDLVNEMPGASPRVVPIVRGRLAGTAGEPLIVTCTENDNVSGLIYLPAVGAPPAAGEPTYVGLITGHTATKVADGLRALFTF